MMRPLRTLTALALLAGATAADGDLLPGMVVRSERLHADSVTVAGLEFTDVAGRMVIDADGTRLTGLTGHAYGGTVVGAIAVNQQDIRLQLIVRDLDLASFVADFGQRESGLAGTADGEVVLRFGDNANDRIQGSGTLRLRQGSVISLPFLAEVLLGNPLADKGQDRIDIDFSLANNRIRLHRIRAQNPSISITGSGTIDLFGQLDITLIPRAGLRVTSWIPLLGRLINTGVGTISGILGRCEIVGPITHPVIRPALF
jgi:hypothetical protein